MLMERRTAIRTPTDLFLNKYVNGYPYLCRALNLSWGGLLIERVLEPEITKDFFPLEIDLPGASDPVWVWARSVWSSERRQALRVVAIERRDERAFADYLHAQTA